MGVQDEIRPEEIGSNGEGTIREGSAEAAENHIMRQQDEDAGANGTARKRIVVVGLGMVGIAFIEKLIKLDEKRGEYSIVVVGEEAHFAYNRVGLTSFFQHRDPKSLYLNSEEWYSRCPPDSLSYHLNTKATSICDDRKLITTSNGTEVSYDALVLATGSDAVLPKDIPGYDARGVFVYRTIEDLERLIRYAEDVKGTVGAVVGGGLLGLEAAKAMMDLQRFSKVKLIDRNEWLLSRQLDSEAGGLVVEMVRELGMDVLLRKRVARIEVDDTYQVSGIEFTDGERIECSCVIFGIGIKARDELARSSGIMTADQRSGIMVNEKLETSTKGVYAIGECASFENQTFGLIAPGLEMADILSFNLTQAKAHKAQDFKTPDLSTKLKLLGVNVASFGDFFADRDGPKKLPRRGHGTPKETNGKDSAPSAPPVKALTYKDPFGAVYKKYLFTMDGQYLLGGMMIGDTKDYTKLSSMVKKQKKLDVPPAQFILGSKSEAEDDGADLDDDTQICSCHNISKGQISEVVKDGTCKSLGEVKSCTKAGTGCGGCLPLMESIFKKTMKDMGQEVLNHICPHFKYSRADLYNIISVKKLEDLPSVMKEAGTDPESLGCEVCKPAVGSILASLHNKHVMSKPLHGLQDTNDKFLANLQRNGTFSVIPRIAGGEITPDKLIVIGSVAKKYDLYTKITGGQRIDLFGAKKHDLPAIWRELIDGGLESGHAYAKALRTVKSCVGTTWCRFGIGDSVGMAIRLEERYKSIRSPHKIKGGVSGCVRECAEAQGKDFGLIATDKGYNIFVGGNGGSTPRHAELLAGDVPPDDVVPILDRFLMFYVRTADRLQRTARWIENLPGGLNYLKDVVIKDKLGIAAELEEQMKALVGTFFCEWQSVLSDANLESHFSQFANTKERLQTMDVVTERGQSRPTYWAKDSCTIDFKNHKWTGLSWQPMLESSYFQDAHKTPSGLSAALKRGDTMLALFMVRGKLYCTQQMCPHRRAFLLSDGLIGEEAASQPGGDSKIWVSCPQHKRNFMLSGPRPAVGETVNGHSNGAGSEHEIETSASSEVTKEGDASVTTQAGTCLTDESLSIATFPVEQRDDGWIYVKLPPVEELDAVLGTKRWMVRKEESEDPFTKMDRKLGNMGRKGIKVESVQQQGKGAFQMPTSQMGLNGHKDRGEGLEW